MGEWVGAEGRGRGCRQVGTAAAAEASPAFPAAHQHLPALHPPVHSLPAVMVCSKFDNRLKEFSERWEVDK